MGRRLGNVAASFSQGIIQDRQAIKGIPGAVARLGGHPTHPTHAPHETADTTRVRLNLDTSRRVGE
jgi:hypothetical protein